MSDTTLPPLRSSSVTDSRPADELKRISSDSDEFAFLVHSKDSVTNGEPPQVDNSKLARQKRKRTSPEDQATLEAEYKRNPKPDKAARLEIVKQVSLGEKEVQIWFQNRRQNTRRKSRPLLPHEIAAFGLGGMAALSSDPITSSVFGSSQSTTQEPSSSQIDPASNQEDGSSSQDVDVKDDIELATKALENTKQANNNSIEASLPTITPSKPPVDFQASESFESAFSLSQPAPATIGYLSNRWNAADSSFSTPQSTQLLFDFSSSFTSLQPSSCPERLPTITTPTPSSQVRLSLSLDGHAELVPFNSSSPPRPTPTRPSSQNSIPVPSRRLGPLQRSQSALPFGPISRRSSTSAPFIPKLATGRSRDARTWEFCCDSEARDELTTQAENESSGSAVAAISLLRSTSKTANASALKTNSNKRNAQTAGTSDSKRGGKKPMLARATSSLARLQTTNTSVGNGKDELKKGKLGSGEILASPGGDSDKENWLPDTSGTGGSQMRRPLPSARPQKGSRRRALENSHSSASISKSKTPKLGASAAGLEIFDEGEGDENDDQENENENRSRSGKNGKGANGKKAVDKEVEKFMRGEVSPSKKGDLDCIQGLLSLSQGNWR